VYTRCHVLTRLVEAAVPVRRGEGRLTGSLFLHSFFAVGAFLTGRSVRDALFLKHGDRETLAWMYVLSAVAVTLTGLLYGRLATRIRRDVMALVTASAFAVGFVVVYGLERNHPPWVYPLIYVFVEVMGALILVQFWTLANELFNAREAKRLYGLIGAGGTVANIAIGLLSAQVATRFGAASLLLLCTVLLAATAGASFGAGRLGRQRLFARAASGKPSVARRSGGAGRVLADAHLRSVALLAAVTFFTTTLVDFQFKVVAREAMPVDQLATFFGHFSALVGALAIGLQLFGTTKLLNRAGVVGALVVLPLSLTLGNAALALFPALWAASMAKGADTLFRYSINDATTQILYLPVPAQARVAAKAFIDGVIKPSAIGLAGVALAAYRTYGSNNPYQLAWLSLVLCLAWLAVVNSLRAGYVKTLQDNLKQKRLDLIGARSQVLQGGSGTTVLERALASTDEREVLNALQLLPSLDKLELDHRVESLLTHPSANVRTQALEYYAHRQTMRFANSIFRCFEDPEPTVRAAAIDAFCAIGKDKAVRNVRAYLRDPHPGIRSAAVKGMIRFGGLDGVLIAAEALKELITHPDAVMRQNAAQVLGAIGVRNFYQPVLELMNDGEPGVRRQAIIAAGLLKSPEFVIPLMYKTQSPDTMREAIDALTAYGQTVLAPLGKVLANHLEEPSIRRAAARVLGRLGSADAVELMAKQLEQPDEELRGRLYKSLARAVKGKRLLLKDLKPVEMALDRELARAWRTLQLAELLLLGDGPGPNTPRRGDAAARALLASALKEKVTQLEHRAFLLLAVLYPDAGMEQIAAGLREGAAADAARRRANAVELLDNLLPRSLKRRFLPLLEDQPRHEKLGAVASTYPQPSLSPTEVLAALCADESAWVRACALWVAAETGSTERVKAGLTDTHPLVREIAVASLPRAAPNEAIALARAHLHDEAPAVRRQAQSVT
jgi:HEAT repeat protein/ATP/ADP translocase